MLAGCRSNDAGGRAPAESTSTGSQRLSAPGATACSSLTPASLDPILAAIADARASAAADFARNATESVEYDQLAIQYHDAATQRLKAFQDWTSTNGYTDGSFPALDENMHLYLADVIDDLGMASHWAGAAAANGQSLEARNGFESTMKAAGLAVDLVAPSARCYMDGYVASPTSSGAPTVPYPPAGSQVCTGIGVASLREILATLAAARADMVTADADPAAHAGGYPGYAIDAIDLGAKKLDDAVAWMQSNGLDATNASTAYSIHQTLAVDVLPQLQLADHWAVTSAAAFSSAPARKAFEELMQAIETVLGQATQSERCFLDPYVAADTGTVWQTNHDANACPTPTISDCENIPTWDTDGGTDPCAQSMRAKCGEILKEVAQQDTGPTRPMYFSANDIDDRKDLTRTDHVQDKVGARVTPFDRSSIGVIDSASAAYASTNGRMLVSLGAAAAIASSGIGANPNRPATSIFIPPGSSVAKSLKDFVVYDGEPHILGCEDYVRKLYWDYTIFETNAAGCHGDDECVYQAAYAPASDSPARRIAYASPMMSRDAAVPTPAQFVFPTQTLPKNPYFDRTKDATDAIIHAYDAIVAGNPPTTDVVLGATMDEMKARSAKLKYVRDTLMPKYEKYYGIYGLAGSGGGTVNFGTEWQYHQTLHDQIAALNLSDAEHREIYKRRDRVAKATERFWEALALNRACPTPVAGGGGPLLGPIGKIGQIVDPDPWDRSATMGSVGDQVQLSAPDLHALVDTTSSDALVSFVGGDVVAGKSLGSTVTIGGVQLGNVATQIGNGQIGNGQIGNGQIGNGQIGNGQIGNTQIGNTQIGNTQIGNTQIGNTQIGTGSTFTSHLGTTVGGTRIGTIGTVGGGLRVAALVSTEQLPDTCQAHTAAAMMAAAKEVSDLLLVELDRIDRKAPSCLDDTATCDWTPDVFTAHTYSKFTSNREADYAQCLEMTNNDFNPAHFAPVPPSNDDTSVTPGYATLADATTDVHTFQAFMKARRELWKKNAAEVNEVPAFDTSEGKWDGAGRPPARGVRKHDSETKGDPSGFSAGYNYDLAWKVTPVQFTEKGAVCRVDSDAWAKFKAGATVPNSIHELASVVDAVGSMTGAPSYGTTADHLTMTQLLEVLANIAFNDTRMSSKGRTAEVTFSSNTILLGEQLYEPVDAKGVSSYPFDFSPDPKALETTHLNKTVQVGPVPVTFDVWGEVHYGATIKGLIGTPAPSDACNPDTLAFRAELNVEPFVTTNAAASVAIGVPGFEAGIRGRVEVITVKVPIHSVAGIDPVPVEYKDDSGIGLSFHTDGEIDLSELGGSLSAFIQVLLWGAEKEIFRWDGLHQTIPLWNVDKKVRIEAFNCVGDASGAP